MLPAQMELQQPTEQMELQVPQALMELHLWKVP